MGDLLLTGPALRAVRSSCDELTLLCSPRMRPVAELLPAVDHVQTFTAAWIEADPPPFDHHAASRLVDHVRRHRYSEALIATSFHQSALPLALLLRAAKLDCIVAHSDEYPGSLLDVRVPDPGDVHEVERNLGLAEAAGHPCDRAKPRLEVDLTAPHHDHRFPLADYVVVHPGASSPARTWSPQSFADATAELSARGHRVVVTGSRAERALTARIAARGDGALDLGGRLDVRQLARVLAGASVVVCGTTGPAHLAAATATPVVSLFPPTVPAVRWRPWGVPHRLLGTQDVPCRGCRARQCPVGDTPFCLTSVTPRDVADAVDELRADPANGRGAPELVAADGDPHP
jgi:ADP-heptose:LPS heptosyltransferase